MRYKNPIFRSTRPYITPQNLAYPYVGNRKTILVITYNKKLIENYANAIFAPLIFYRLDKSIVCDN